MAKRTVAVLGLSVFGREIALGLATSPDIDVVVFDYRKEEVDAIAGLVPRAIVGDIRQTEILEQEGARSWSAAVVGIRRHFDITVLVTHFLKRKLGVRSVIVQVNSQQEEEAIRVVGADLAVFPERDSARHLVATFMHPLLTEVVGLEGDLELVEVESPRHFVGKSLRQLELRTRQQIHVVAVRRHGGAEGPPGQMPIEVPPNPDRPLLAGERMMLMGHPETLKRFLATLPNI